MTDPTATPVLSPHEIYCPFCSVAVQQKDRLAELAKAATPGPWHYVRADNVFISSPKGVAFQYWQPRSHVPDVTPEQRDANGEYMAAVAPEVVLALLAEVATLTREKAWQPIETAPQMRKVMVFYVNALGKGRCVLACYYKAHSLEMDDDYADVGEFDEASGSSYAPEGWYEEHQGESPLMPLEESPTHWQPLPAPPASKETL